METKKVILILITVIIIVAIVLGACLYLNLFNQEIEYKNVNVTSTFSVDIPISDNITNETISNAINVINDTKYDVVITSFNTADPSFEELITDGTEFASLKDSYIIGSKQIKLANQTVWYNLNTGYYMVYYTSEDTHDNVFIVSKNNEIIYHIFLFSLIFFFFFFLIFIESY